MSARPQNWAASRYGQRNVIEQPQPEPPPNRELLSGAVQDPYGIETRRKVRVTIAVDALDRLLQARRIQPGEYAAARSYQKLLEIALGGSALDKTNGARTTSNDDAMVRSLERAGLVIVELRQIENLIGWRSERLLRQLLIERHPDGRAWTLEELAGGGKHRTFAVSQRVCEALQDLCAHWRGTRLE